MLPVALLRYSVSGDRIAPHFFGAADHPWLRSLIDDAMRFVGRRRRALEDCLRVPLAAAPADGKQPIAAHVLQGLFRDERRFGPCPRTLRAALFGAAAHSTDSRTNIMNGLATSLGLTVRDLEESLFSDLPSERIIAAPPQPIAPLELALRSNLAIAQTLLYRSESLVIDVEGHARALVRHAKLHGLICVVEEPRATEVRLQISGPLALFRRTLLYGRALGGFLPLLSWSRRFRLRAACHIGGTRLTLELGSGDPLFPSAEPRRFDSRIEQQFARDFARLAIDWDVVREPQPVRAGAVLVFPDFALAHRDDASRRWLVEIVGFWTPDYLARKLAHYRRAGLPNLILCIDEQRDCSAGDLPVGAVIIRYRRRIDAGAVLAIVSQNAPRPDRDVS